VNINVTGRHVNITDSMRDYAKEKIQKLEKFAPGMIIDAHIIMDVEKYRQLAEVTVKGNFFTIHAKEETGDMYSSIDILLEKLEKKLRHIKEKVQDHHHKKSTHEAETILHVIPKTAKVVKDEDNRTISLISEKMDAKPLFLEDAVLTLDESNKNFLVFMNAETNKINVIHKIGSGQIGVIETL
jgi:putative sigma-54 modulation protein